MQDLRAPMWCTSFLENERVSRTRRARHSSVSGRRGFLGVGPYDVEGPHGGRRS
jgi:hypothetical protein